MFDVPPDLRERKWRIQAIGNADWLALSKLFPFSNSEQLEKFMRGVTIIQSALNHHGELSLYEGEDRVRFSTWTMEKENDTIDPITETDLRLARQIETFYTNLMKDGTPKPALFLDFDGTVRDVVEDPARAHKGGFRAPYRPEEVAVYPQVADILELWDEDGYFLVGATNQSGVGRGDLTEASAVECIEETVNQIGIGFPVFYSTSKKAANYKPRIGMGLAAIEEHGPFDLEESIMVGDNHRGGDENFAHNLGITFIHADDFFHLSKDQRKGRAAETFTSLNSEAFPQFECIPTMTLFNTVLPNFHDRPTRETLKKKKIPELKRDLRGLYQKVGGNKPVLIDRLLEAQNGQTYYDLSQNPHLPAAFAENWTAWCDSRRPSDNTNLEYLKVARMSASFINAKIHQTARTSEKWTVGDVLEGEVNLNSQHELWKILSQNPHLPPEIIEEHWGKWNMGDLSANPSLTPEIIEAHWNDKAEGLSEYWAMNILAKNPSLTPEIINLHWAEWNYRHLIQNHAALTTEIVVRHWDTFLPFIRYAPAQYNAIWDAKRSEVAIWPNLAPTWITSELIEKGWGDWGDVDSLGHLPALTMDLIEQHLNSFSVSYLTSNPNLTSEFIQKTWPTENENGRQLLASNPNPEILIYLIENFSEFTKGAHTARYNIAQNPNLTEELMEKYWDKWDYDDIAQNPHISPDTMKKHWDVLEGYGRYLFENPSLFPCGNLAGPAGFPLGVVNWRL